MPALAHRLLFCLSLLAFAASGFSQPQRGNPDSQGAKLPISLTVVSATKKAIKLRWNPSESTMREFVVERKVTSGEYKTIGGIQTLDYTDIEIAPYGTYTYRVVSKQGNNVIGMSNEVKVGPPPYGFITVAPAPKGSEKVYGRHLSMTLDANDDPMIAWIACELLPDDQGCKQELLFRSWSRAEYKWSVPTKIVDVGATTLSKDKCEISLSRDPKRGTLGLAYRVGEAIWLAKSANNGAAWTKEPISPTLEDKAHAPSLVLFDGKEFLAYISLIRGQRYAVRVEGQNDFKEMALPKHEGLAPETATSIQLAVDKDGIPAVAYWAKGSESNVPVRKLVFWQPNSDKSYTVCDGPVPPEKCPSMSLAFHDKSPSLAILNDRDFDGTRLFYAASEDGTKWPEPVALGKAPTLAGIIVLALNDGGDPVISCGMDQPNPAPFMVRKNSAGKWMVPLFDPKTTAAINSPNLAFIPDRRLYLAFEHGDLHESIGRGVVIWHQSP